MADSYGLDDRSIIEPPENLRNYVVGGENDKSLLSNNVEQGSPAAMLLLQQQQQKDALNNALNAQQQEQARKTLDMAILNKQKAMLDAMVGEKGEVRDKDGDGDGDVEMKEENETKVLLLLNMVNEEDIKEVEEYDDIKEDIQCECENFGNLLELVIPKIGEKGCGRVFLKYDDVVGAKKCRSKVDGRKFGVNTVKCVYFDEGLFGDKVYDHKV